MNTLSLIIAVSFIRATVISHRVKQCWFQKPSLGLAKTDAKTARNASRAASVMFLARVGHNSSGDVSFSKTTTV